MQAILNLLQKYNDQIKLVMTAVIGLVAVVFISVLIIKAIKALSNQSIGDAAKNTGYAILVAFLAWLGISGVINLMNSLQPGSELGITGGNFQLIMENAPNAVQSVLSSAF